jgi:hypothetical protein
MIRPLMTMMALGITAPGQTLTELSKSGTMNRLHWKPMRRFTASQAIPITFASTCMEIISVNSGFRFQWPVLAFCTFAALCNIPRAGAEDLAPFVGPDVEKYNVVWDSPRRRRPHRLRPLRAPPTQGGQLGRPGARAEVHTPGC